MERLLALYIDLETREEGQTMVEYALVLGFVVAVAAIALVSTGTLGKAIDDALKAVGNAL
jgi:pilus assembly protein Flp/PilA